MQSAKKVYILWAFESNAHVGVIITPTDTEDKAVSRAWSYAVKNTPKSLLQPDYDAALQLLLSRHSDWMYAPLAGQPIRIDLNDTEEE